MIRFELVTVAYTDDELSAAVSPDTIPDGKVRGVFLHGGKLWALTGATYGDEKHFDAEELIAEEHYTGERTTYHERSNLLHTLDAGPHGWGCDIEDCPECAASRAAASARRRSFYEGMPVSCKGQRYRFGPQRQTWRSIAATVSQGELFA
jgi:hypothetical protein